MEENQKSPLFTELTDSQAESLSGGGKFWRTVGQVARGIGAAAVVVGGVLVTAATAGAALPATLPFIVGGSGVVAGTVGQFIVDNNPK